MSRATLALVVVALGLGVPLVSVAASVDEQTVTAIAAQLRCVVCQSLSVADSPSETAHQMRGVIRERLAAGQTPDQIKAYFVEKYGEWILLAPPRRGFTLLVWIGPYAALLAGVLLVIVVVRRWSRRPAAAVEVRPVDEAMRQRIRRELAEMDRE